MPEHQPSSPDAAGDTESRLQHVPAPEIQSVSIRVATSTGEEVFFKIKRSTRLEKLMDAYEAKTGRAKASLRFLFDGYRVSPDDTPNSLDIEEGDTIEVMVQQVGGHKF